jgi:uncharacterized coiled-coil DUF342 family protein
VREGYKNKISLITNIINGMTQEIIKSSQRKNEVSNIINGMTQEIKSSQRKNEVSNIINGMTHEIKSSQRKNEEFIDDISLKNVISLNV